MPIQRNEQTNSSGSFETSRPTQLIDVQASQFQPNVGGKAQFTADAISKALGNIEGGLDAKNARIKMESDRASAQLTAARFATINPAKRSEYEKFVAGIDDPAGRAVAQDLYAATKVTAFKQQLINKWEDQTQFNPYSDDLEKFYEQEAMTAWEGESEEVMSKAAMGIADARAELFAKQANWNTEYSNQRILELGQQAIDVAVKDGSLFDVQGREEFLTKVVATKKISFDQVNDMVMTAIESNVEQGNYKALDIIVDRKEDGTLVDKGRGGSLPWLYSSKKYKARIDQLVNKAQDELKVKEIKRSENEKFIAKNEAERLAEADQLTDAWLHKEMEKGTLTSDQSIGFQGIQKTRREERKKRATILQALAVNDSGMLALMDRDGSDKLIQQELDNLTTEYMQKPDTGASRVMDAAIAANKLPTLWGTAVNNANPASPKSFLQGFAIYDNFGEGKYKSFLESQISDEQSARFALMKTLRLGGFSDEEALPLVASQGDAETIKRNKSAIFFTMSKDEGKRAVANVIPGFEDIFNSQHIYRQIENIASAHMAPSGGNPMDAIKWGAGRIMAKHTRIGNNLVYTNGPISETDAKGIEWWIDQAEKQFRANSRISENEEVTLASDGMTFKDGSWAVVAKDTQKLLGRVNLNNIREIRKSTQLEEEVKQGPSLISEQKERTRRQEYFKRQGEKILFN